jgi:hypothetical protein
MPTIQTKYEITYGSGVIQDPDNPGNTLLFDAKSDADLYIENNKLPTEECDILALVIAIPE